MQIQIKNIHRVFTCKVIWTGHMLWCHSGQSIFAEIILLIQHKLLICTIHVYYGQSSPFDVCNCTCTCQHMRHKFDACKKEHMPLLFLTHIAWDIGMKKIKEKAKASTLTVDHFLLTLLTFDSLNVVLPCITSE